MIAARMSCYQSGTLQQILTLFMLLIKIARTFFISSSVSDCSKITGEAPSFVRGEYNYCYKDYAIGSGKVVASLTSATLQECRDLCKATPGCTAFNQGVLNGQGKSYCKGKSTNLAAHISTQKFTGAFSVRMDCFEGIN